jgi:hypothetical protein
MCNAGETANQCRTRLYRTPPDTDDLDQTCWNGSGPANCMHLSYLPRCGDGTDACVEDEAVCQDGTRPAVFAEAATAGPSDVWLFHLGGEGGPCNSAKCWFNYRFGSAEFAGAMSTLHPDLPGNAALRGAGIFNGSPTMPYARLNRVRFERCSDAISDAVEVVGVANGVPPELAADYPGIPLATATGSIPVWHRGFDTWRAAFHHMTTLAGRDRDGDGTPELPSLADARLVILSASSDASMWVSMGADLFAAELRAIAGPDVEVRIMIDGNFPSMLDSAGRYHPSSTPSFDMVATPYGVSGLCQLPDNGDGIANEACSNAAFLPGGDLRGSYEARGVKLDASCEARHGAGAWQCYDRNHVLVHHLDVPILVLADQEDNTISGSAPAHATDRTYGWGTPEVYRRVILDEAWDLIDSWSTGAREEGAGPAGGLVLIHPKARRQGQGWGQATHVRFHDDVEMARGMTLCTPAMTEVASATFTQMLGAWINDALPQTHAIEDATHPLPGGNYWVTGGTCRAAE